MTIHTTIQTSARGPRRTLSLHWRSTLRVGHVVSFRFPLDEKPELLAKARPCLVVDRWHDGNTLKLALAYGTTQTTRRDLRQVVVLDNPQASEIGLEKPTRFYLDRSIVVSIQDSRFHIAVDRNSPIIGYASTLSQSRHRSAARSGSGIPIEYSLAKRRDDLAEEDLEGVRRQS